MILSSRNEGVECRGAREADFEWLCVKDDHQSAEWIMRSIRDGAYLVAVEHGALLAFLRHSWFWGTIPYMEMIRVNEDRQVQGIGTALIQRWENDMRSAGARVLLTSTVRNEPQPQAWHRRNGFRECGQLTFGTA